MTEWQQLGMSKPTHQRREIVITGQGLVTPLGRTPDALWERWRSGDIAAEPSSEDHFEFFGVPAVARVKDFAPRKEIRNRKLLRLLIDGEPFGLVAVTRAFESAGLTPESYVPERAGVAVGCHKEGFRDENLYDALDIAEKDGRLDRELLIEEGIRRIPPQTLVEGLANAALYYFAHEFRLQGANHNFIASGTGGSLAIGESMRSIRRGEADVMLAGGYDTWLDWRCVGHQHYLGALIPKGNAAAAAQRPFDVDRNGGLPGEGAGMLILESGEHAAQRSARPLGRVEGFAAGTGNRSATRDSQADLYARIIRRAIDDAGSIPEEIDLVHLQGEGSADSDWVEATAVASVLGSRAAEVPATTIKSTTGLLGNASGPVELVMTCEMLRRGEALPIVNLRCPDPDFSLNFVREPLRRPGMKRALLLQRSWPCHFVALVVSGPPD